MDVKIKIQQTKNKVVNFITVSNLSFLLLTGFVIGIFTTETHRVISTVCMIILFALTLTQISKKKWKENKCNRPVLLLTLVFFLHLFDGLFTDFINNIHYLETRVLLKIPFLLLPFCILFLPKLTEKKYHFLMLIFALCSVYIAVNATFFYITHPAEVHDLYLRSKTIPLPLNHVRFSLILSLSIFLCAYLVYKKAWFFSPNETKVYAGLGIFLFIFIHLLSVRSGLLAFYLLTFFIALIYAWQTKKYKLISITLLGFILIPIGSYFTIGTFRNKVQNTVEDLSYTQYEYYANFHSLTARVYSYKVAFNIIKEKPLLGVGIGNLEREVNKTYVSNYSEINPEHRLMPHNQYINYLTAFGILGSLVFYGGFYGVLFFKRFRSNLVLWVQFLIITISFLFESTIETQLGCNFTLSFLIIPLYYLIGQDDRKETHS